MAERTRHSNGGETRLTPGRSRLLQGLTFAFIVVCLSVPFLYISHEHRDLTNRVKTHLSAIQQRSEEFLATDRYFLQLLADEAATGELDPEEFQNRAAQYASYHPYLINITWADAAFIIRDTAPLEPNKQVIGLKLDLPEPERASRLARQSGEASYTRPFVVLQGVHAFEVYVPIFNKGNFLGTFGAVYSVDRFQDQLVSTLPKREMTLQLIHVQDAPPPPPNKTNFAQASRTAPLKKVPDLQLRLSAAAAEQPVGALILLLCAIILAVALLLTIQRLNREYKRRQQAETELSRNERLYRSVFDYAGLGIILAAPDRTILQTNQALDNMLGYQPGELKGVDYATLNVPGNKIIDLPEYEAADREGAGDGQAQVVAEKAYLRKDGQITWANLTTTCLRRADGTPELLLGLLTDISERQTAEQALMTSEKQYRNLFQTMVQGVIYITAEGQITGVNSAVCEILGLGKDQLLNLTSQNSRLEIIHEDGSKFPDSERPSRIAIASGTPVLGTVAGIFNPRDDDFRWLMIDAIPEFNPGEERPFRVFVTLNDITALKQAEALLKESEASYRLISQQFQTLLNTISDPMYMLDPDGSVLWSNQRTREMIGPEDQFSHARAKGYFGQLSLDDMALAEQCFSSGQPQEHRSHLDNGRIVTMRAFPIKDDSGQAVRVLMHIYDETDKLRMQETLIRTGQLAAVGELAAGVAHEINNPINGVINYADILTRLMPKGSEAGKIAERILHEGERIAAIASSLLAYTRQGSSEKRPVALREIVSEVLLLFGTKMRNEGISIFQEIPADLPNLLVSPQQIQQVFLNLLSNARYALKPRTDDKRLKISARDSGNGSVKIEVWDNGTGIPAAVLPRIQDPFFTTKPGQEGTGLGLSICHNIISDHHSALKIESEEGVFTRISFELPINTPESLSGSIPAEA